MTGGSIKKEGMKPYEILPIAAIFGGAKALMGIRDKDVKVFMEVRMVDSVTGERQGSVVRRIKGELLQGKKDQLPLNQGIEEKILKTMSMTVLQKLNMVDMLIFY